MDTWLVILVLGQLAFFAFLLWIFVRARQETLRRRSEERLRILERFSSDEELAAFLGKPEGRRLLDQYGGRPPRPETFIILATAAALLMLFGGAAFLFLTKVENDFIVPAVLILTAGIGTLTATGISMFLARKFGMLTGDAARQDADMELDGGR